MSTQSVINFDIEWRQEHLVRTQQVIETRPYEIESWSILLREAQTRPIHEVRSLYESLVNVFPTTARYWMIYIDMEVKAQSYERAEKLFQRCLLKILNIDLWKLYLNYVKVAKSGLSTYKEKLAHAYNFAVEKIGMDVYSLSIWQDYIQFLHGVEAFGNHGENQKVTALRQVYQKAIVTPIVGIEQLWEDYIDFEHTINPTTAEAIASKYSKDYMHAKRVAKDLENYTKCLNRNLPAVPPTCSKEEAKQVALWKRLITFECSNPLRSDDSTVVMRRVILAIEQCLLVLTHHPSVWYQAAKYLNQNADLLVEKGDAEQANIVGEECSNILERSINGPLNRCQLLYFAFADFEEGRLKYDRALTIYNNLLTLPNIDPTLVYVQYMRFARRNEGIKSARSIFKLAREDGRIRYHIFVAAALMEYHCSRDVDVAFRIFELGLHRFGNNPEYIMCYIDYLMHLNEDNNTRVLFERILSSSCLTLPQSIGIWNRFLEFETRVGDLSSVNQVERRRSVVCERLKEYEGKETVQLVDRYKFLNLFPCTSTELKSIGYDKVNKSSEADADSSDAKSHEDANDKKYIEYPRPDFAQMIPYKPCLNAFPGAHPLTGGIFPLPPALATLSSKLPPPISFRGPFVSIQMLINAFMHLQLPDCMYKFAENIIASG